MEDRAKINKHTPKKTTHLIASALRLPKPLSQQLPHKGRVHTELRAELLERGEVGPIADEDELCS
jgi:hypothetical protein